MKKTKILALLLALCLLLCAIPAILATEEGGYDYSGEGFTAHLSPDGVLTISGTSMPDYYYSDDAPWSNENSLIKSVVIEDGITNIGRSAFTWCVNLTSVTIPDSVTSVGPYAFNMCSSLTSITLPETITAIGDYAFAKTGLTSLTIPASVTEIIPSSGNYERNPIAGCTELTELIVSPDNPEFCAVDCVLYSKDKTELLGAPALFESFTVPSSVKEIEAGAFAACYQLQEIKLNEGLEYIWGDAFFECYDLSSIEIPSTVEYVQGYAFRACTRLKSIEVAEGNKNYCSEGGILYDTSTEYKSNPELWIIPDALEGHVDLLDGITTIPRYSFGSGITGVSIPKSVSDIEDEAFANCALRTIELDAQNENYCMIDGMLCDKAVSRIVAVAIPEGTDTVVTIPASVTTFGTVRFAYYEECIAIKVAEENSAFCSIDGVLYNKDATELLAIPAGITGKIRFPASLSTINWYYVPDDCPNLTAVEVDPQNEKWCSIDGVVYDKNALGIAYVPNGLTGTINIPASCVYVFNPLDHYFEDCPNLEAIQVDPENANWSSIDGVLYNKDATELICIPRGFSGICCLPASLNRFEVDAFQWCRNMTEIRIDEESAFYRTVDGILYDKELTEIICAPAGLTGTAKIPASVEKIHPWNFLRCAKLQEIVFLGSKPEIEEGEKHFRQNTYVYYPAGDTSWDSIDAETRKNYGGIWQPYGGYKVIDGAESTWTADSGKALSFRADGALADCTGVVLDGAVVDPAHYTLSEGSTIVELHADFLKTLSAGEHTLRVLFKDGTADTTFTVKAAETEKPEPSESEKPSEPTPTENPAYPDNPKTGDIALLVPAVLMSVCALFLLCLSRKKRIQ